jgi:flagellar biosynthesis/type III secretory pathway protein FliH
MSATDTDPDADGEEPTVEDVLADLTNGFSHLAESHGDLAATVEDLQETVEQQADLLGRVLEAVDAGENADIPEDVLAEVYEQGVETGAEKGAEKGYVEGYRRGKREENGADATDRTTEPRGFW